MVKAINQLTTSASSLPAEINIRQLQCKLQQQTADSINTDRPANKTNNDQ